MCYQGVEIIEYLCFKFVINECHKCSFTITLLLLWITVITQLLYIEANFLQKFRDVSMPNFSLFFNQGVLLLPWKSSTSFLWLKMFQWDSDRVTEQVVVVCVCRASGGLCVIQLPSLMPCKVASVQKIHRGHPPTSYFWNEKSTTGRDGINRTRCLVLLGQTETLPLVDLRGKREGEWDVRICSAPAEINSRVLLHFFFVAKQEHVVNISFPPITLSSTDTFTFTHCQMKPQLKTNTCSTCSLVQYNRVLGPHLREEKKKNRDWDSSCYFEEKSKCHENKVIILKRVIVGKNCNCTCFEKRKSQDVVGVKS